MPDRRTYVRLHDGLPDHPKIAEVGGEAAWLYVSGLCYCSRQLTDGTIPVRLVARMTDLSKPEALASRLLEAKLWHPAEHDCPECPQGVGDVYVVHDYLDHQRSAADVRELSEKRAAAGRTGGKASGTSRRREAKGEASASGRLEANAKPNEAETETDKSKKKTSSSSTRKRASRIPDDFAVTPDMVAWARQKTPRVDGARETEKFTRYWRAKSTNATKLDWVATWENWMLNAADRLGPPPGLQQGHLPYGNDPDPNFDGDI